MCCKIWITRITCDVTHTHSHAHAHAHAHTHTHTHTQTSFSGVLHRVFERQESNTLIKIIGKERKYVKKIIRTKLLRENKKGKEKEERRCGMRGEEERKRRRKRRKRRRRRRREGGRMVGVIKR